MEKPIVLVADDNQSTCTLIAAILQRDFTIEFASDGAEAIDKLRSRHYSGIILDLLMPVIDGYGVLDFIGTERPELMSRVVIVSAALSARQSERVAGYPVHAVMAKPFEVDALLATMMRCSADAHPPRFGGPFISGGMMFLFAELIRRVN